jgi:RNA polymerase sigma factor (sigma-70 family)
VIAAGQEDSSLALETLCQTYWFPIYAYIRHRVAQEHDAQDMTQAFFEDLLSRQTLAHADPDRGRFRAYLLTACKRFLANQRDRDNAQKRGGNLKHLSLDFALADSRYSDTPQDGLTSEILFEQQWAIALIDNVLATLRQQYAERDKLPLLEELKPCLTGQSSSSYAEIASRLHMSETAIKVEAHRLKIRYRESIRSEIGHTVDSAEEVEDEIRRLFEVLSQKRQNPV